MSSYGRIAAHRSMVFDKERNRAYFKAIEERVNPESIVLDLGAGVGVLGLEAARQGAHKVYLVDSEPVVHLGGELARSNRLGDRIEVVREKIEKIQILEPVDVILSVFTGNFLLEEDLLPLLFHARDRFLRPGGTLIPDRARMEMAPVEAPVFYNEHIDVWGPYDKGLDFSAGKKYAINTAYFEREDRVDAEFLATPRQLSELDLAQATKAECRSRLSLQFEREGICHGLLGWFSIRLGTEWLSTSPSSPATHWSRVFLPLDPPLRVERGQSATIEVIRPEYGDWSWALTSNGTRKSYSTFLSTPIRREDMEKTAGSYRPRPHGLGVAARAALAAMDGCTDINEITDRIHREYIDAFRSRAEAERLVRRLVRKYA